MEKTKIKVMIADHHFIFRTGLKSLLGSMKTVKLLGEATNNEQLVAYAQQSVPDVILIDAMMPGMDAVSVIRELCRALPECRVVILSVSEHENTIVEMIEAGAIGYLLKNADSEEIEKAINTVYQFKPYFCRGLKTQVSGIISRLMEGDKSQLVTFSDREREIICLICEEYTSKEIARVLYLSKRTVEGHRTRIMYKMGVKSIAGIITYALDKGLYRSN